MSFQGIVHVFLYGPTSISPSQQLAFLAPLCVCWSRDVGELHRSRYSTGQRHVTNQDSFPNATFLSEWPQQLTPNSLWMCHSFLDTFNSKAMLHSYPTSSAIVNALTVTQSLLVQNRGTSPRPLFCIRLFTVLLGYCVVLTKAKLFIVLLVLSLQPLGFPEPAERHRPSEWQLHEFQQSARKSSTIISFRRAHFKDLLTGVKRNPPPQIDIF